MKVITPKRIAVTVWHEHNPFPVDVPANTPTDVPVYLAQHLVALGAEIVETGTPKRLPKGSRIRPGPHASAAEVDAMAALNERLTREDVTVLVGSDFIGDFEGALNVAIASAYVEVLAEPKLIETPPVEAPAEPDAPTDAPSSPVDPAA